jgi:hypothetical protein
MLDEHHLLVENDSDVSVLKLDYNFYEVSLVAQAALGFKHTRMIIDQLNNNNFLAYNPSEFVTGSFIGDEIVIGPCQKLDLDVVPKGKI